MKKHSAKLNWVSILSLVTVDGTGGRKRENGRERQRDKYVDRDKNGYIYIYI